VVDSINTSTRTITFKSYNSSGVATAAIQFYFEILDSGRNTSIAIAH